MQTVVLKLIPAIEKNTLTFSTNYRLFSTKEPVTGADSITSFSDSVDLNGNNGAYLYKKFRYSTDRGNWSLWYDSSEITSLTFNGESLFVEFKYEYNDTTSSKLAEPIVINEIKVSVLAANTLPNPFTPNINCTEETCPSVITTGTSEFNPYATDEAVNVFKQLSFNTNLIFGHEVIYFKTEPDRDGADYIFKEWTLFKTIKRKCIKVLVPGNKFPDSKPTYGEFGIDFEIPFEVSIDHQYFQTVFGAGQHPRKRDFLYFPLTNRMYEIQGTYIYRGIMQEPVYWKVQLVKFQPNIDMMMKAEDRTFLDNIITSTEELFGEEIAAETVDVTNPQQLKTITEKFDETRQSLHPDLRIKQANLTYNYSPIIQYYYATEAVASEVVLTLIEESGFTSKSVKMEDADNLTIIAYQDSDLFKRWISHRLNTYDLSAGSPIKIRGPYNSNSALGRYIKITRFTDSKFRASTQIAFTIDVNDKVSIATRDWAVVYNKTGKLEEPAANLTYFALFKINSSSESVSFIEAFDNYNSTGIRLAGSLSAITGSPNKNLVVNLELNSTLTTFDQLTIEVDKWYAIFVPLSVQFKQAAISVYGFNQDPANPLNYNGVTKIGGSAKTLTNVEDMTFSTNETYRLYSSAADIANIRVFNTMIQEEDHDFVISQLFLRDESMLTIIDNCRPRLNIPYIGINR